MFFSVYIFVSILIYIYVYIYVYKNTQEGILYLCKNACGRFAIFDAFTASISPLLLFSSSDPRPEPSMQEWRRE